MEMSLKSALQITEADDTLVVMMHFPPFNSRFQKNAMSALFEKYGVDKVVYGHLHNSEKKQRLKFTKKKIQYFCTNLVAGVLFLARFDEKCAFLGSCSSVAKCQ
jgi:predicted phosphohydrolase